MKMQKRLALSIAVGFSICFTFFGIFIGFFWSNWGECAFTLRVAQHIALICFSVFPLASLITFASTRDD